MTQFVGAEYIIANLLIKKYQSGKPEVSLEELGAYGIEIQKLANKKDLNLVFLTSKQQLYNAVCNFPNNFKFIKDDTDQIIGITISKDITINDLIPLFIAYLPIDIIAFLKTSTSSK